MNFIIMQEMSQPVTIQYSPVGLGEEGGIDAAAADKERRAVSDAWIVCCLLWQLWVIQQLSFVVLQQ